MPQVMRPEAMSSSQAEKDIQIENKTLEGLRAAAPGPPARAWTDRRGTASGGAAACKARAAGAARGELYFQAGFAGLSLAVATFCGHTTSNSPFCHWPTVPGVPTFSLPLNLMSPMMVLCVVLAT